MSATVPTVFGMSSSAAHRLESATDRLRSIFSRLVRSSRNRAAERMRTFPVKLKNICPHIQTFRAKVNTWIQCHFPVWSSDGHWSNDL